MTFHQNQHIRLREPHYGVPYIVFTYGFFIWPFEHYRTWTSLTATQLYVIGPFEAEQARQPSEKLPGFSTFATRALLGYRLILRRSLVTMKDVHLSILIIGPPNDDNNTTSTSLIAMLCKAPLTKRNATRFIIVFSGRWFALPNPCRRHHVKQMKLWLDDHVHSLDSFSSGNCRRTGMYYVLCTEKWKQDIFDNVGSLYYIASTIYSSLSM